MTRIYLHEKKVLREKKEKELKITLKRLGSDRFHLPNPTRTPHQPFKHTLVAQKVHSQDPSLTQP